jgi:hypothetical protein
MSAHSYLSASGAYRWMGCPGSVRLSASMPRKSSSYASEGTAAHSVAEKVLREAKAPEFFLGQTIVADGVEFEVTEEMVEAVRAYANNVVADAQALVGSEVHVEKRFKLDWLDGLPIGGTCDAVIVQPFGKIVVHDFKYGEGIKVDPTMNPQLMVYGLGAIGPDGALHDDVELCIDQTRVSPESARFTMPVKDLLDWGRNVLVPAAHAALSDDAPLNPDPERCRFCAAASICPALRQKAAESALVAFDPIKPQTIVLPDVASLTPEQRRRVLDFADAISGFAKAVKDAAFEDLRTGRVAPEELGYKLVRGRGRRAWKDENLVKQQFGFHAIEQRVRSPAQLEAALKELGRKPKEIEATLADYVETSAPITMAPLADKRPAVQPAALAFEGVKLSS